MVAIRLWAESLNKVMTEANETKIRTKLGSIWEHTAALGSFKKVLTKHSWGQASMYEHITASGSLSNILTEMKLKSGPKWFSEGTHCSLNLAGESPVVQPRLLWERCREQQLWLSGFLPLNSCSATCTLNQGTHHNINRPIFPPQYSLPYWMRLQHAPFT